MRIPIIAGNWKMNKTASEARQFVNEIKSQLHANSELEAVLIPPDLFIESMIQETTGTPLKIGAQNCYSKDAGSYTGETSPFALKELGVSYVILGHSERRAYFGETDATVSEKAQAVLANDMFPIICVGETLEERESNETNQKIQTQIKGSFEGIDEKDIPNCVIAYEPIWAIGSGKTASASQANEVAKLIRETIASLYSSNVAEQLRIQYGGSVKPENISEFLSETEIDGALVGGASLEPTSFLGLLEAVTHD